MTERINEKILKHEFRLNQHEKEIMTVKNQQGHDSKTLESINKQLSTIKTVSITAVFFIIASAIGVIDTIKTFL